MTRSRHDEFDSSEQGRLLWHGSDRTTARRLGLDRWTVNDKVDRGLVRRLETKRAGVQDGI
jgi:hypothetical protein